MSTSTDKALLTKIIEQNLYCDEASIEKSTGKFKRKFKLAIGVLGILTKSLDIYTFFITTSNKSTCNKHVTLTISRKGWEKIHSKYRSQLRNKKSYIDIRRIDSLTKDELLDKMKNKKNQFKNAARLTDKKFKELKLLPYNISRLHRPIKKTKANTIINGLISPKKEADILLKKLGL